MNPFCRMGGTELVAHVSRRHRKRLTLQLFAECKPDSMSKLCITHAHEIPDMISLVASALMIKGALTIITFGIKLPAGIFIPSLVVGACFGRIMGLALQWVEFEYPHLWMWDLCHDSVCVEPGLYAMVSPSARPRSVAERQVGAAATLAGVTRTTVSLAVIVLELTNTLNYVVPVMLGVLIAKTVADGLEKKGIYDLVIK